ncbi:uncharacterized protein LOC133319691 [Danaus plexippus]|uniref:Odorant-binding protein 2 n=1 Tax=Danaus plexippus plexippus TaxID=278856 RepID=A0A212EJG2_DANPL|nr:uncharacterized protein LOC116774293 [Danaus plexippus]XP_061380913.1 uncharacterized protein LOC133319691 [Danaus plexippus]OWR41627.1 odorant-binding protein 2 precursor [Danaus plexippus plexippus]
MFLRFLFPLMFFVYVETDQAVENNRMVGVDTVHDIKIDKDTIITRNMNLKKKNEKSSEAQIEQKNVSPDWSYSSFPEDVKKHVDQFKRNMSECLKEVHASDKRPVKRLSPKKESPVHGDCLIACVLKRNSVIENGKIHKENLIALVKKFYEKDEKLMKKLERNLDRCIETSARDKDDCAIAARLNECTNDIMTSNKHKIVVNY